MRKDLLKLLSEREIVHPTRITAASWRGRTLSINVAGFPWWEGPYVDRTGEGRCRLVFEGLGEGCLRTDEFDLLDDEALEDFSLTPVSETPWAQASDWSIYCSGALPEPLALYMRLQDELALAGSFLGPEAFLNGAARISAFRDMAARPGFLLARGPAFVRDVLLSELDRLGVAYNVVPGSADAEPQLLARLAGSAFFCEAAFAEYEPLR
ncbi:hypothetical protein [Phenylobacterium sp.]|uniref:hypothetical protein n=1 Tax=Phenylobacterium sp. TaxID=1871053 RepID=UPI002B8F0068|nr:hypothetical protein [Phenylobacterium sp.]HVI31334.1 hypothetical protein [Phenylobacterium sp.]